LPGGGVSIICSAEIPECHRLFTTDKKQYSLGLFPPEAIFSAAVISSTIERPENTRTLTINNARFIINNPSLITAIPGNKSLELVGLFQPNGVIQALRLSDPNNLPETPYFTLKWELTPARKWLFTLTGIQSPNNQITEPLTAGILAASINQTNQIVIKIAWLARVLRGPRCK
jgi:hypothetical protein